MNATLKNLITNPFVIGGTVLGAGVAAGAVIYAKHRPKTEAEVELEKLKEKNAEAEREREHQREIEKIKAKKEVDEVEARYRQEEITKRQQIELEKLKEKNAEAEKQFERDLKRPPEYWQFKAEEAKAERLAETSKKEADLQREIAKMQMETAKYTADKQAHAAVEQEKYGYLRQRSSDSANASNVSSVIGGLATMVTGKNT